MRVAVGCDHAGFPLKPDVLRWVEGAGHEIVDVGAHALDPHDDYPDFARAVAEAVRDGRAERGVVVCGSGVGAAVAACKVGGVRASVCHDPYSAAQGVEHDDLNVLCLGARIVGAALAELLVSSFLAARFTGEERHVRRLRKVEALEAAARGEGPA